MEGKHKARVEETIHQLIAGMLVRKVKDPRVANVSIIRVEASRDYSVAKIYYNVIGGSGDPADIKKGLDSCKGFIRNNVKKELRLRVIPELIFIYDSSLDRAMALEELIGRIHEDDPRTEEDDGAAEAVGGVPGDEPSEEPGAAGPENDPSEERDPAGGEDPDA